LFFWGPYEGSILADEVISGTLTAAKYDALTAEVIETGTEIQRAIYKDFLLEMARDRRDHNTGAATRTDYDITADTGTITRSARRKRTSKSGSGKGGGDSGDGDDGPYDIIPENKKAHCWSSGQQGCGASSATILFMQLIFVKSYHTQSREDGQCERRG
jgi:hypothetical protein